MATVRPFKAIRPAAEFADKTAALPYDVMDTREAKEMVALNSYSFLRIDRAEINLPQDTDPHSAVVYKTAKELLNSMISNGVFVSDESSCFYVYSQSSSSSSSSSSDRSQTGIVGCASTDEYRRGVIKKHEHTRPDKEDDRFQHVDVCEAHTGPIFFAYKPEKELDLLVKEAMSEPSIYDFDFNGTRQTVWKVSDPEKVMRISRAFERVDSLYIADGHHRAAAAVREAEKRRAENPMHNGNEEYNYFLSVFFPYTDLHIMDYNRVVSDLNGLTKDRFLLSLLKDWLLTPLDRRPEAVKRRSCAVYLGGSWYSIEAKPDSFDGSDPVASLDVSILQNNLLTPILGIEDVRKDKRIDFVGGIRGLAELERMVDSGKWAAAFAMCPTDIKELMEIADRGEIMPPKSTWFEPKLLSGLFIHKF